MRTLQEYESSIESLEAGRLAHDEFRDADEEGVLERIDPEALTRAELASFICQQAYTLQSGLVRTLWSAPYKAWARDLIARCQSVIRAEQEAHGLIGPVVAPRFEATVDPNTGTPRGPIW